MGERIRLRQVGWWGRIGPEYPWRFDRFGDCFTAPDKFPAYVEDERDDLLAEQAAPS